MSIHDDLDIEIELISSSLLPAENLESSPSGIWPRIIDITSQDSELALHVIVDEQYKSRNDLIIEVKSPSMGRDEASKWKDIVKGKMEKWNEDDDYPLYQILTTHFLSILAPSSLSTSSSNANPLTSIPTERRPSKPHHCLLISHHLLSSTKRKNLISLSSKLSLVGFSKVGHPGIMYSIGREDDLEEWIREVKSWNWLALRIRISPETIEDESSLIEESKGVENGARGGKGRGDWTELEKINEALDWLRSRGEGRDKILIDAGVGGG
ncbi:uncharacterized protein I206_104673 [Kwoniella pini CBS 10737]|uniref:Uncharacterized protein n=1 Tax=Kwoniella pini CBS 10737 TaxID=1296096 RepID=A0A1B9I7F9_9TREE|nr:uncharacterized protein I206_02211 [Kwoniella pini CBS 10737]OCF51497.1 hypothetical protein I206_02211 [Kwoniella pini CBS 10737]